MDAVDLRDLVGFDPNEPARTDVFESERLWSELVCLERNQQLGPLSDPDSDAVFLIVAGEVVVQVNGRRKRLGQWSVALAPEGSEVSLTNASPDPAVVLVVAAPPPTPRAETG
jgi:quercetin dioxygenase-like cupin family protein